MTYIFKDAKEGQVYQSNGDGTFSWVEPPSQTGWIPATERLPEPDKTVLVWNVNSDNFEEARMGYYDLVSSPITGWRCAEFMEIDVTHWQPLPPKPETAK